nr:MAG TPA: hypothetical protein [Caudoviricetes sp.]
MFFSPQKTVSIGMKPSFLHSNILGIFLGSYN